MARVGLLLPRHLTHPTGIVTYSKQLALNLNTQPHAPSVVLLNRSRDKAPDWFQGFEVVDLVPSTHHLPLAATLQVAAQSARLDIVHATGNVAPFLGPSLGVRRVATVHDMGPVVRPK